MKKLDLHGIRHDDVDRLVENFIFKEDFPHQIITGHSTKMNSIVVNTLEKHGFVWSYTILGDYGSVTVKGKNRDREGEWV
jgi:hypothetical protein